MPNIQRGKQKFDILDFDNFDNFDNNNNKKNLIDPHSFKDSKALGSFIKEVLDVRANHSAQVLVYHNYLN